MPPADSSLRSSFEGTMPPGGSSLEGTMPPHGNSLHSKASGSCCGEGPAGGPCSCALLGGAELPSPICQNGVRHSFDSASIRSAKQMPRQESAPDGLPPLAPPPLSGQVISGRGGLLPRQSLSGNLDGAPSARGPPGPEQPSLPLLAQAGVKSEGGPAATTEGSTSAAGPLTGRGPFVYQPPRPSRVLLLMELGDQRSLHTAISKGRLSGNLVRPKNKLKTKKTNNPKPKPKKVH